MTIQSIEIIVQEELNEQWAAYFEGLRIQIGSNGSTCLSGEIADQPALHALLERIRDLNLHLVSVQVKPVLLKGN
jgi:hypothetical protein